MQVCGRPSSTGDEWHAFEAGFSSSSTEVSLVLLLQYLHSVDTWNTQEASIQEEEQS